MFDYMYILYLIFISVFFTWFVCLPIFHLLFKRIFKKGLRFRLIYAILLVWNILDAIFLSLVFDKVPYFDILALAFAIAVMFVLSFILLRLTEEKNFKNFVLIATVAFLSKYPAIFVIYLINNFL